MQKPAQITYPLKYYSKDADNDSKLFEGVHNTYQTYNCSGSYNYNDIYFAATASKSVMVWAGNQVLT